jgi:hypothetical protein
LTLLPNKECSMGTKKGPVKTKNYGLEFKLRAVQIE